MPVADEDKTTNTGEESAPGDPATAKPVAAIKPSVQRESAPPVSLDAFPDYFWSSLESGLLVQQWEVIISSLSSLVMHTLWLSGVTSLFKLQRHHSVDWV